MLVEQRKQKTRLTVSSRNECYRILPQRAQRNSFYQLKESWKFSSATNRLGKYYFPHAEYHIARIEYEKNWDMKPSRFNNILVSLASELKTKDDVQEAEFLIEEKINTFINVYTHKTFSMACNQTAHPL